MFSAWFPSLSYNISIFRTCTPITKSSEVTKLATYKTWPDIQNLIIIFNIIYILLLIINFVLTVLCYLVCLITKTDRNNVQNTYIRTVKTYT